MIADMGKTGKGHLDLLLIAAIIVAVGVAAFGLGRLSAPQGANHGFAIHPAPATAVATQ